MLVTGTWIRAGKGKEEEEDRRGTKLGKGKRTGARKRKEIAAEGDEKVGRNKEEGLRRRPACRGRTTRRELDGNMDRQ